MDIRIPVLNDLGTTAELIACGLLDRVIVLTIFDTDDHAIHVIETDASGFLLKNIPPGRLLNVVQAIAGDDSMISPGPTRRLLRSLRWRPYHGSSSTPIRLLPSDHLGFRQMASREKEVLVLAAVSLTSQKIYDQLWLSVPMVKARVGWLSSKMGSGDRVQLVPSAPRTGVTSLKGTLQGTS